jgi:hypothetical protein
MTRDELIADMAAVISGLQVPVSLGMNIGKARDPWGRIFDSTGFGWKDAETIEAWLRETLG